MASKRWDLCVSHKDKNEKWRSVKVGVIFEGDNGQLQIRIDPGVSVGTPDGVMLTGWLPKERDERGGQHRSSGGGGGGGYGPPSTGGDDDIPFAPLRGECI